MRDDLRPQIAPKPPPVRTHFRVELPSTARSGHARRVHFKATHAPQPCHQRYAPLPNWRSTRTTNTHFPRCNSPLQPATQHYGQPNSSTHWHHNPHTTTLTSQPPIHSPTSTAHTLHHQHPIGQPYNPTQTPSGQADSALQTEYTHKLPVVRSQHAESALLPGAAVQQRHSKDTPMAHQRPLFIGGSRKGSPRADVALAVQRQPAPLRWDVLRIGGPD